MSKSAKKLTSKPRKKLHALIWWVRTGDKNVIPASSLPKNDRTINSTVTLTWTDESGIKTKHEAKIIAMDYDLDKLENVKLTTEGEIIDSSQKLFFAETIQEKKELNLQGKIMQQIQKSNITNINRKIKNDAGIFVDLKSSTNNSQATRKTETLNIKGNFHVGVRKTQDTASLTSKGDITRKNGPIIDAVGSEGQANSSWCNEFCTPYQQHQMTTKPMVQFPQLTTVIDSPNQNREQALEFQNPLSSSHNVLYPETAHVTTPVSSSTSQPFPTPLQCEADVAHCRSTADFYNRQSPSFANTTDFPRATMIYPNLPSSSDVGSNDEQNSNSEQVNEDIVENESDDVDDSNSNAEDITMDHEKLNAAVRCFKGVFPFKSNNTVLIAPNVEKPNNF